HRQTVVALLAVEDAIATGGGARVLDRGLDAFGSRVREVDAREVARSEAHELFRERAAEPGHSEFRQVGKVEVEGLFEDATHLGMVSAERENAEPSDEVEVAMSLRIEEVGPEAARPDLVEAEH